MDHRLGNSASILASMLEDCSFIFCFVVPSIHDLVIFSQDTLSFVVFGCALWRWCESICFAFLHHLPNSSWECVFDCSFDHAPVSRHAPSSQRCTLWSGGIQGSLACLADTAGAAPVWSEDNCDERVVLSPVVSFMNDTRPS